MAKVNYSRVQEFWINRTVRTYPSEYDKETMAIDEWIEVCNRDFSLMPAVRTLVAMCRQGHFIFIGITKRCKRAHEMFYGPGEMGERRAYSSRTESKENQAPKRRLLYKFWQLFLGDVTTKLDHQVIAERKFDPKYIPGMEGQLKPNIIALRREKLEREMKGGFEENDSAIRMLNGVANVYRNIQSLKAQSTINDREEEDFLCAVDESDAQLTETIESQMNEMQGTDDVDEDACEDDDDIDDVLRMEGGVPLPLCLQDLRVNGVEENQGDENFRDQETSKAAA